jgi:hypothetical protein
VQIDTASRVALGINDTWMGIIQLWLREQPCPLAALCPLQGKLLSGHRGTSGCLGLSSSQAVGGIARKPLSQEAEAPPSSLALLSCDQLQGFTQRRCAQSSRRQTPVKARQEQ